MKATDHTRITEEAIRRFVRHSASPVAPMLLRHSRQVQHGAREEDLTPLLARATNWHFYNRNLDCDVVKEPVWSFMEPLVFHLSSDRILRRHCDQLAREAAKGAVEDCCELTGRILHHIQDMSIPAHVVPIYHGPLIADSFEEYLHRDYLFADGRLAGLPDVSVPAVDSSQALAALVLKNYQTAAEATLALLSGEGSGFAATVDNREMLLPWSFFWADRYTCQRDAYPAECTFAGFGRFGPLGKDFGTSDLELQGVRYRIEPEVYVSFCERLCLKMLADSLATLAILEPLLRRVC